MKTEPKLFWKTFFITQYEGAFRTGEVRKLKWSEVNLNKNDGFVYVSVSSKKNTKRREKKRELPLKESLYYLEELKKQQRTQGINSDWVFPSPMNPNKHISKAVNLWFNKLTKKALGKQINPYLLRHTRGTELNELVSAGKMSKSLALQFMGHNEEQFDKCYNHVSEEKIKQLMKEQIYNFEYLPEEKKHELEQEIEVLQKNMQTISDNHNSQIETLMQQMDFLLGSKKGKLPNKKLSEVLAEAPQRAKEYELLQAVKK